MREKSEISRYLIRDDRFAKEVLLSRKFRVGPFELEHTEETFDPKISICTYKIRTKNSLTFVKSRFFLAVLYCIWSGR